MRSHNLRSLLREVEGIPYLEFPRYLSMRNEMGLGFTHFHSYETQSERLEKLEARAKFTNEYVLALEQVEMKSSNPIEQRLNMNLNWLKHSISRATDKIKRKRTKSVLTQFAKKKVSSNLAMKHYTLEAQSFVKAASPSFTSNRMMTQKQSFMDKSWMRLYNTFHIKANEVDPPELNHENGTSFLNGTKQLSNIFNEKYQLNEVLGEGSYGFVLSATRKQDGKEVAVKFLARDKVREDDWVQSESKHRRNRKILIPSEVAILQNLSHPNIINYMEHLFEPFDYVLLVTELHGTAWQKGSESCDLLAFIDSHPQGRITEYTSKKIFAQIGLALQYLQINKLVHRDLKAENVTVDFDHNVKLIDFGSAAKIPSSAYQYFADFWGTEAYASPEQVAGQSYRGPESEMWALGVLLYLMVYGEYPFSGIQRQLYNHPHTLPSDRFEKSSQCRSLLQRLFVQAPADRATINEVLKHGWCFNDVQTQRNKQQVQPPPTAVKSDSVVSIPTFSKQPNTIRISKKSQNETLKQIIQNAQRPELLKSGLESSRKLLLSLPRPRIRTLLQKVKDWFKWASCVSVETA